MSWLEKAFVIYRCRRYDLQGKSVLKTQEKLYLADSSLNTVSWASILSLLQQCWKTSSTLNCAAEVIKGLCRKNRKQKEIDFVPLRTIQQYEQRQKSINKAMAERLIMLAKVLCCEVEDLIEKCE